MTTTLLVVDDDRRIKELLTQFLSEQGYRVYSASNAAEARSVLASHQIDLMILDIMMPGEDGIALTKSLRSHAHLSLPILILSAKDTGQDRILGLEEGCDDYLVKPFDPHELLARIKAILRRSYQPLKNQDILKLGEFDFYVQENILKQKEELVYLSSTESVLLKTLAQAPRQPFAREDLAQRIGHRVSDRTIDVQITRLRKKLGDDPKQPKIIQTIRHIGYALYPQ